MAHPATERSDVTTARAAALFNQAARADLLGDELTALLFRVGAARAVACVATTADGTPHLMSARGWNDAEALAAIAVTPPLPRLELGTWRERHWSLIVDVPPTVTARTAFVAVRTLADCSRTVDNSRRQEREKSALWPMDPVEDATHGVFASEAMLDLIRTIRRVAQTPVTILLTGETGTGKDILARLVHEYSPRAGKMFVPFNCTAVPREMLDSQLFGHRRGAFTGAQEQSPGVIRATQGGTLFLDEIGELGPEPQVKLLRFLESNEVHPIGEAHPVQVGRPRGRGDEPRHRVAREGGDVQGRSLLPAERRAASRCRRCASDARRSRSSSITTSRDCGARVQEGPAHGLLRSDGVSVAASLAGERAPAGQRAAAGGRDGRA